VCIKIIRSETVQEFDMSEPLDQQIDGAQEIVVSYDPLDPKIDSFVGQIELMVANGVGCKAEIRVDPRNCLKGLQLERRLEKLKKNLDVNEIIKGVCHLAADTDRRLHEISKMCTGKTDER
jgi:hypothetical protein